MNNQLPVLIVGAGPAGLMMACQLAQHGVPFRIIDKNLARTQGSNATWIQTRTLEIFDAMGVADRFIKKGHHCRAVNLYASGELLANIPLDKVDSIYPFVLMLPQRETEQLLEEHLAKFNMAVERQVELLDIKQADDVVISTLRLPNGDTQQITSRWVIACDGANSTVRTKCQMSFSGNEFPEQFMVADATMSSFLPNNEVHVFFDPGTIFPEKGTVFAVLPCGSRLFRLNANLYLEHRRQSFTDREVREVVAERSAGNYHVDTVSWISPFWVHSRTVDHMRQGAIFLVGDAAHIHAPIGGQGMNAGLQDAYNLAWKLAFVIKNKAKPALLDSYQAERYPIVRDLVNQTEFFTNMMLFDKSFFSALKKFGRKMSTNTRFSTQVVAQLTLLDVQYQNSPVIDYEEVASAKSLKPGQFAPDVLINSSQKLYGFFDKTGYTVLLFAGEAPTAAILKKLVKLQHSLMQQFSDVLKVSIVTPQELPDVENVIVDAAGRVRERYQIKKSCVYVIRPDNYIAYASKKLGFDNISHVILLIR
jgi:2-polyprenyl-6-methoxyphenol hydroxylase-like FAD-dependent oxidoreductase